LKGVDFMGGTWPSIETRLWSKVDKSGECWIWKGSTASGYGQIQHNGKMKRVHRLAWELENGEIPEGLEVLHNCPGRDNPLCVRLKHLWLGTHKENMHDRDNKGWNMAPKGEASNFAKLTNQDVIKIRELYKQNITQNDLAEMFNVSKPNISMLVNHKTWRHID
jgi:predicted XRE-type DNA-binding protein